MLSRVVAGLVCVLALAPSAFANGRTPATSTIRFEQGDETHIAAGMTFGLLRSSDNGASWTYMCEDAVGYGGMYDPDYELTASGALFATTFDGSKVTRDACTWAPTSLSPPLPALKFVSTMALGSDGALYVAAADPKDSKIYKSTDDGATFPIAAEPGKLNDWWQSLEVAPSNPGRLYLAGYRLAAGQPKEFLLFRSDDGGRVFDPLPVTDFRVMPNSAIEIVGISRDRADLVFARVTLEDNSISDGIYRSTNGGQSWQRLPLDLRGSIAFLVRASGELVAGTQVLGSFRSLDNGDTWQPLVGAPHISCLAENSAGEVWACTQNYGVQQIPADGFGIMKSTDLATWTGVLKFQDINLPVSCPAGTVQYDRCDALLWCGLCEQLGCDPKRQCGEVDGAPVEPGGCCQADATAMPGLALLALAVALVLRRRRKF